MTKIDTNSSKESDVNVINIAAAPLPGTMLGPSPGSTRASGATSLKAGLFSAIVTGVPSEVAWSTRVCWSMVMTGLTTVQCCRVSGKIVLIFITGGNFIRCM